jgi:hypothetical protein
VHSKSFGGAKKAAYPLFKSELFKKKKLKKKRKKGRMSIVELLEDPEIQRTLSTKDATWPKLRLPNTFFFFFFLFFFLTPFS